VAAWPPAKTRNLGGTIPVALKHYLQCHVSDVLEQYNSPRLPLCDSITATIAMNRVEQLVIDQMA
jgi:hypothetical protein